MAKSRDAFRTISEVADWLDTPAHVLRFWESKFSQIKPVKRAGGRRYYRPQDMELLSGIKTLLHEQGMTIKGAQKLLREKGVKHVSTLGAQLEDPSAETIDITPEVAAPKQEAAPPPVVEEDPNDPWPADPWPAAAQAASEAPAEPAPQPAVAEPSGTRRPIPALPDANAAQPRPGILAPILAANPASVRRNRENILPLLARLSDVSRRASAG